MTEPRRILCAHADENGEGAHWKTAGEPCPRDQPRAEEIEDAMDLSSAEVTALARRILADRMANDTDWLQWEDYPNLSEQAFYKLQMEVDAWALTARKAANAHDRAGDIDSMQLLQQAQP